MKTTPKHLMHEPRHRQNLLVAAPRERRDYAREIAEKTGIRYVNRRVKAEQPQEAPDPASMPWTELKRYAAERGIYRVGMKKADVLKQLNATAEPETEIIEV